MPLFQLILTLTLFVLLFIIQRLYHGLRIVNSRVDILSSLLKNLKEEFRKEFKHNANDDALQEYLHNESILQAKMSRDFTYQVSPKSAQYRGKSLMRSDIHDAVPTSPPQETAPGEDTQKSRFKRHPSFSIPAESEPLAYGPASTGTEAVHRTITKEQDHLTHTLSQSMSPPGTSSQDRPEHAMMSPPQASGQLPWDTSPTLLSEKTLQPLESSPHTVQENTQSQVSSSQSPLALAHTPLQNTPTALEHLTFQEATYKKLAPPPPDHLSRREDGAAQITSTTPGTREPTTSRDVTQQQEHPMEMTHRIESDKPRKPLGLDRLGGLFDNMEKTVDTARSSPLSSAEADLQTTQHGTNTAISPRLTEPDTAITDRANFAVSLAPDTAVSDFPSPPVSPSQEDLLGTFQAGQEGSELRIKKDLTYMVKTPKDHTSDGGKKPLSIEQIPSLSFLSKKKDQGS